jgi:hypothetical protein
VRLYCHFEIVSSGCIVDDDRCETNKPQEEEEEEEEEILCE